MPDQSINWLRCYQQLVPLTTLLQQAQTTEQFQAALQLGRELNSQLQHIADDNLAAAIAQLSIIQPDEPATASRAIKGWVLLALWSRLKHWPKARRDTLGICVLLASCAPVQNKAPTALQLAARLKSQQSGGIFTTVLAGTFHQLQKRHAWQVHHDSPLLTLALELAQQLQAENATATALEQVLAAKINESNDEFVLEQLNLLAQLAPALYLCGRLATDMQQRYWLLCHADGPDYQALQYWPEQQRLAEQLSARPLAELTIQPPAKLLQQHWLAKVHIAPLPEQIIPTPNSLLQHSILPKLSHHDLDAQLALVEKQPILVQFLLDNASESNRQHTLVNRLRHALAIFGQEQLPLAVARAELLQYLQLQGSNQHGWLLQLQHTLHYCLQRLGQHLPQPLTTQQAGLIAACCSAPLWHHPSLQAVPLSKTQHSQLLLGQLCQQYLLEPVRSQRLSAALLQHYRLEVWADAALLQYQQHATEQNWTQPEQLGLFLRLCWQLTFSVFCYPSAQQSSQKLLQLAGTVLSLPQVQLAYWQQELLNCQALYYPLP